MKNLLAIFLVFSSFTTFSQNRIENSKALESIRSYTQDEFFKHDYNIEIIDFKINSIKKVRLDSMVIYLIEAEIYNIAAKIVDPSLKNYSDFDINKLNSHVIDQASNSRELDEYSRKFKKFSNQQKAYKINAYLKFRAIHNSANFKKNLLWTDQTFILAEDFTIIDAPKMF
jgi:hypothetical protein